MPMAQHRFQPAWDSGCAAGQGSAIVPSRSSPTATLLRAHAIASKIGTSVSSPRCGGIVVAEPSSRTEAARTGKPIFLAPGYPPPATRDPRRQRTSLLRHDRIGVSFLTPPSNLLQESTPMKKLLFVLLLVPVLGWAQSPFDGTWKVDLSKSKFPTKPDELLLKDGMFECKTCKPEVKIKADGQFQPVSGHPYYDKMMVKVVDDKHVESATTKDGKDMAKESRTVSDDGNTMTI